MNSNGVINGHYIFIYFLLSIFPKWAHGNFKKTTPWISEVKMASWRVRSTCGFNSTDQLAVWWENASFFWKCDAYLAAFPYNPGTNHQIIKHVHQISEALQKKKHFQIQLCVFSKVQRSCNFQHLRVRVFCWTSDPLGHLITGRQLDEGNVHLVRCTVVPTPENKELSCEYAKFMVCFSMIGDLVEGSGWFI